MAGGHRIEKALEGRRASCADWNLCGHLLGKGSEGKGEEIERDLEDLRPMNRLVQGDVGSGKTVVSEMAMFKTVKCGFQAVMIAPTELLAKQHIETLRKDFA